eukprot:CAMPEP_0174904788 /NCGR_PEP_ID=MMETSP0167-20121228/50084_1 /TAXON_ID=38298 /ORGANISM="Rhodella maculata, Strain CCMP736" /LENGTH=84 /DNA_ID=CAMNT_0016147525 /DNA_START=24 /DNA_END=275 /DNA_ORIENTATION=-
MTPAEFQSFMRLLFWMSFYGVGPTTLFDLPDAFAVAVEQELRQCPRSRFMVIYDALGRSDSIGPGRTWTPHFDPDRFMIAFSSE